MIRCKLLGHKFIAEFVRDDGHWRTCRTYASNYCVRCGAARLERPATSGRPKTTADRDKRSAVTTHEENPS